MNRDEEIAKRHAGIVTPPLFDLLSQTTVTRGQLMDAAAAFGFLPDNVSRIVIEPNGIEAEILDDGQVKLVFWPKDGPDL